MCATPSSDTGATASAARHLPTCSSAPGAIPRCLVPTQGAHPNTQAACPRAPVHVAAAAAEVRHQGAAAGAARLL